MLQLIARCSLCEIHLLRNEQTELKKLIRETEVRMLGMGEYCPEVQCWLTMIKINLILHTGKQDSFKIFTDTVKIDYNLQESNRTFYLNLSFTFYLNLSSLKPRESFAQLLCWLLPFGSSVFSNLQWTALATMIAAVK